MGHCSFWLNIKRSFPTITDVGMRSGGLQWRWGLTVWGAICPPAGSEETTSFNRWQEGLTEHLDTAAGAGGTGARRGIGYEDEVGWLFGFGVKAALASFFGLAPCCSQRSSTQLGNRNSWESGVQLSRFIWGGRSGAHCNQGRGEWWHAGSRR